MRRLALPRANVEQVREEIPILQGNLPTASDGCAWHELALCRGALDAQGKYARLRPGFCLYDYPREINAGVLRNLIAWWRRLAQEPELARDLDICAFLDRVETDAAGGEEP